MPVAEICRKGGFSDATFYKWRSKFGGMEASDAKLLRELEAENAKLKKSDLNNSASRTTSGFRDESR